MTGMRDIDRAALGTYKSSAVGGAKRFNLSGGVAMDSSAVWAIQGAEVRGTQLGATPRGVYTRCVGDFQGRAMRMVKAGFHGEGYAWTCATAALSRYEAHRAVVGHSERLTGGFVFEMVADWARERAGRADVERRSAPDMERWSDAESRVAAYRAVRSFALDCAGLCRSVGY
jgi:hypothetical protein